MPRILIDHHRLNLGREERTIGNRQHVHASGHDLLGQGEALAVLVLADVFGHVFFEFLKAVIAVFVVHAVVASLKGCHRAGMGEHLPALMSTCVCSGSYGYFKDLG